MSTWRKKKCIRALGLEEGDCSDSEDGGNLSSVGGSQTTDGESLAGGSPMPDHHLPAAVPSLYGSPVLPKSPLVSRPLLSPLVPPTTPPTASSMNGGIHSPSSRHLNLPSTPSSSSGGAGYHPHLLQHSPARRLHPSAATASAVASSSATAASATSSSMLLAT